MTDWAEDFSFGYLRRLLDMARQQFSVHRLDEAPSLVTEGSTAASPRRVMFLRHDVDLDLPRALTMARIEAEMGLRASYAIMVNSAFYDPATSDSRAVLRQLGELGHEIALHFDFDNPAERVSPPAADVLATRVARAGQRLGDLCGMPVRSMSFHRPIPVHLRGPLEVGGLVNAYGSEMMGWYMSDSCGRWRDGEPLPRLARPRSERLQLLIHPIWWGVEHQHPAERLQSFYEERSATLTSDAAAQVDADLAANIRLLRRGLGATVAPSEKG